MAPRACGIVPSAVLLLAGFGVRPAAAQRPAVELRVGVAASTALATDEVAASAGRTVEPVTLRAAPAPVVTIAARVPLRPAVSLEGALGWTFSELRAEEGFDTRDVQGLGIGHGVVAVRYAAWPGAFVRGGIGAARYVSDRAGIFSGGARLEPLTEVGAGWGRRLGRIALGLELALQAHTFGTPALEAEGVQRGGAYRVLLQAGVGTGGAP